MRECRTYGSVRGALGNGRPYRDQVSITAANAIIRPTTVPLKRGATHFIVFVLWRPIQMMARV
jgi:hypothetical protein